MTPDDVVHDPVSDTASNAVEPETLMPKDTKTRRTAKRASSQKSPRTLRTKSAKLSSSAGPSMRSLGETVAFRLSKKDHASLRAYAKTNGTNVTAVLRSLLIHLFMDKQHLVEIRFVGGFCAKPDPNPEHPDCWCVVGPDGALIECALTRESAIGKADWLSQVSKPAKKVA